MRFFIRYLILAMISLCLASSSSQAENAANAADSQKFSAAEAFLKETCQRADALVAQPDLESYRGWLKYLSCAARTASSRKGIASDDAVAKAQRLDEWTKKIAADPKVLETLRGVQEWAYESPADGTGQPFRINIPTDYNPAKPPVLTVYMHGYSGNHIEHATGMVPKTGSMDVSVLGRARGGWYRSLSEADVLNVVDYIQAHWNIDADHVHLNGGSMGGGGTFRLGSRYPHRWASGRPSCGYAINLPIANLLTYPIYATHSDDDFTVPILESRGPLCLLRSLGGQAISDETTGLGHAVWGYEEGNRRAGEWEAHQVRPCSKSVKHIDYTATDGGAVRGWWAEVAEWGPAPKPAHFNLKAGADNLLYAQLHNITRLRLLVKESPFDAAKPLKISVNGVIPFEVPAPLPDALELLNDGKTWKLANPETLAGPRLHTPGGASMLYQGEPLLIVYGTQGSDAENKALRSAAEAASKSPNPSWAPDDGEAAPDGVPHRQILYGKLNVKADTEVSDADIARCHLVLIGTTAQNALVARMAERLPVKIADGKITCSDGLSFPSADNAFGLVTFNPLAPSRLVYWVASEEAAFYRAGALIPEIMDSKGLGIDFMVMSVSAPKLCAARSFDSRWNWNAARQDSPLVPSSVKTDGDLSAFLGEIIRTASGGDFALMARTGPSNDCPVIQGVARMSDLSACYYYNPVAIVEMTGEELTTALEKLNALPEEKRGLVFQPAIDVAKLDKKRSYRVSTIDDAIWGIGRILKMAPKSILITDLIASDAFDRYAAPAGAIERDPFDKLRAFGSVRE
jgi:hypothetical protein